MKRQATLTKRLLLIGIILTLLGRPMAMAAPMTGTEFENNGSSAPVHRLDTETTMNEHSDATHHSHANHCADESNYTSKCQSDCGSCFPVVINLVDIKLISNAPVLHASSRASIIQHSSAIPIHPPRVS